MLTAEGPPDMVAWLLEASTPFFYGQMTPCEQPWGHRERTDRPCYMPGASCPTLGPGHPAFWHCWALQADSWG